MKSYKIQNRVTFKIKYGYYLELLTPEPKITKDKNGENMLQLEITEVVLVRFSIINNQYQHDSSVLFTFVQSKLFGQALNI